MTDPSDHFKRDPATDSDVERSLAEQLDEMFGPDWRAYASPIRALFEAAPDIVARLMSGSMENAVARRHTPEMIGHQARALLPDELPPDPESTWIDGFETAARLHGQELRSMAKASDEAARISTDDECWADYAQRMRAANERALDALRSGSSRALADAEVMLSDALCGEGPALEDERESVERWISSLQARRLRLLSDGPPVYDRVEDEANPRRHEWAQLRACGMLYMANTVLHAFGWAIVVTDDGDAYPARTSWRGFPEATQARAHHNIAGYLRLAGDALEGEARIAGF